jgi:hypothetical protein
MVSGGDVPSSLEVYVGRPTPVASHAASLMEGSSSQVVVTEDGRPGIRKDDINVNHLFFEGAGNIEQRDHRNDPAVGDKVHADFSRNDDTYEANLFELDGFTSGSSFEQFVGLLHSSGPPEGTVPQAFSWLGQPSLIGSHAELTACSLFVLPTNEGANPS